MMSSGTDKIGIPETSRELHNAMRKILGTPRAETLRREAKYLAEAALKPKPARKLKRKATNR